MNIKGRMLTLLIGSVVILWFTSFDMKTNIGRYLPKSRLDRQILYLKKLATFREQIALNGRYSPIKKVIFIIIFRL